MSAFLLALICPAWSISGAIGVALGVPMAYLVAAIVGLDIVHPPSPNLAATLVGLLPSTAGALAGRGLRHRLAAQPKSHLRHR